MPTIHYYGKKTNFVGKTLFEILANLRNFGTNRIVMKQEKKEYYVVRKVEPVMDEKLEQGVVYAEQILGESRIPILIDEETWHTDWQLVPRNEEFKIEKESAPKPLPPQKKNFEMPPLMSVFIRRHNKLKGVQIPSESMDYLDLIESNQSNRRS